MASEPLRWRARSFNRGLSPEMASIVQALAYGAYDDFIELVASGRDMSEQAVREVADGLVWTGAEAADRGLVDELGGLDEAVAAAARLAGVESGELPHPGTALFESVLLQELSRSFGMVAAPLGGWFESLVSLQTRDKEPFQSPRSDACVCPVPALCAAALGLISDGARVFRRSQPGVAGRICHCGPTDP